MWTAPTGYENIQFDEPMTVAAPKVFNFHRSVAEVSGVLSTGLAHFGQAAGFRSAHRADALSRIFGRRNSGRVEFAVGAEEDQRSDFICSHSVTPYFELTDKQSILTL